jgi:hypothetical protein
MTLLLTLPPPLKLASPAAKLVVSATPTVFSHSFPFLLFPLIPERFLPVYFTELKQFLSFFSFFKSRIL